MIETVSKTISGGMMASWFVCSALEQAFWFWEHRVVFFARHFPQQCLSPPSQAYEWVPANLMLDDNLEMDYHCIQGVEEYSKSPHATETGMIASQLSYLDLMQTQHLPYGKQFPM